jgi:hypothetical protein
LYLRQNRLLPLIALLKVDQNSPYYHEEQKGSIFYAESWALTHYIVISDAQKGTDRLHTYAELLIRKEDPIVAAQQAFGDLTQLQNSLNRYISQGQFMMFKMNKVVTVERYQAAVARTQQPEQQPRMQPAVTVVTDTRTNTIASSDGRKFVIRPDSAQQTPKYPTEAPTGPHHIVTGILRGVHCGYPSVLTLSVDRSPKTPAIFLYRNDFTQIEFSAADFTPKSDLNPCTDLEGPEGQSSIRRGFGQVGGWPDYLRRAEQIAARQRCYASSSPCPQGS